MKNLTTSEVLDIPQETSINPMEIKMRIVVYLLGNFLLLPWLFGVAGNYPWIRFLIFAVWCITTMVPLWMMSTRGLWDSIKTLTKEDRK